MTPTTLRNFSPNLRGDVEQAGNYIHTEGFELRSRRTTWRRPPSSAIWCATPAAPPTASDASLLAGRLRAPSGDQPVHTSSVM